MTEKEKGPQTHPAWNISIEMIHDSCTSTIFKDEGIGAKDFDQSLERARAAIKKAVGKTVLDEL